VTELPRRRWGSYADLADEYYDPTRHPTSTNFRAASLRIIDSWIGGRLPHGAIVDVGAGDSIVGELFDRRKKSLRRLTLLDASPDMLRHSERWISRGARPLIADATTLPLGDASVALLVASLGDPFNKRPFWERVTRVLRPRGFAIYTTPSYEWAARFRPKHEEPLDAAEFATREGDRLLVPSIVLPESEQIQLFSSVGLATEVVQHVLLAGLEGMPISPKLSELGELPVVTGYLLKRPLPPRLKERAEHEAGEASV
jgi:SAM-dependent methyltransferase